MYMIKFHMRMTLLPTAPSMFQNQKLRIREVSSYSLGKNIEKGFEKISIFCERPT